MKYDDASWHYGGTFPADLPDAAAATHIGMFLYWAVTRDKIGAELLADADDELAAVRGGDVTGAAFVMSVLDGKLLDDDLDDDGNAFALAYYEEHSGDSAFITDYIKLFGVGIDDVYRVPDTVDGQDAMAAVIDRRYAAWVESGRPGTVLGSTHRDWRDGETRRGG